MPIYTDITDAYDRQVVQTIEADQATYAVIVDGVEHFRVTVPESRPLLFVLETINAMAPGA